MSTIAQISTSLLSATNQNTLALANLNLDFSLIKVCPPKEYESLGTALSQQRRESAEDGTIHRTARRLAALFEPIIPPIPNLTQVYGQRVSEIANSKNFTCKSDASYGPFQRHVGLDATSIYAAATSGSKAIALHLLACMLARSWSGPEAIAIWVELVEERKKEIEAKSDPNEIHGLLARMTAQQEISRVHLAAWDASARSWLRSADEVKRFEQTQLRLIMKDSGLPVSTSGTTYSSVIEAWTMAMASLQKLVVGIPQNISKGSILLGLLSWHIYPDLNVVEPTANIQFHDPLVEKGGVVTLGLQREDSTGSGVYWSLALSHLRFYGDPVPVERSIGSDSGRLTLSELHLVALGSVISSWSDPAEIDILEAADCFVALGECLSSNGRESEMVPGVDSDLHWLELLIEAASGLLVSTGLDREHGLGLVEYGRRRGRRLLDPTFCDRVPMFGLANPLQLFKVSDELNQHRNDIQASLAVLRRLAKQCGFNQYDCIIRYSPVSLAKPERQTNYITEYTTAIEIPQISNKRDRDGQGRAESVHMYWAYTDDTSQSMSGAVTYTHPVLDGGKFALPYTDSFHLRCSCRPQSRQYCPCEARGQYCSSLCACFSGMETQVDLRCQIQRLGQSQFHHSHWRPVYSSEALVKGRGWIREFDSIQFCPAPSFFTERYNELFRQSYESVFREESDYSHIGGAESIDYRLIAGDFVLSLLLSSLAPIHLPSLPLSEITKSLRSGLITKHNLFWHLDDLVWEGFAGGTINPQRREGSGTFLASLQAMAAATELYSEWPEATVSIDITNKTLGHAYWVYGFHRDGSWGKYDKQSRRRPSNGLPPLKREPEYYRAVKFAAIAMLESGTENLHPDQLFSVMAMGCGNSIYVDDALLQDPSETSWSDSAVFGGIRRILGSLDRPGIVFLVPPQAPRVRDVDLSSWKFVQQASFDGSSKDLFNQTSLHLSFTEYEIPLGVARGGRDVEVVMLETLVSVHDGRQWVADLDILGSFAYLPLKTNAICHCGHVPNDNLGRTLARRHGLNLKSIENWDDLLCCRDNLLGSEIGIVRTYNNPYSRLAAAAVCIQKGFGVQVLPSHLICTEYNLEYLLSEIENRARRMKDRSRPFVLVA